MGIFEKNTAHKYHYYFIGGGLDGSIEELETVAEEKLIVNEEGLLLPVDKAHKEWPYYSRDDHVEHVGCDGVFIHIRNENMLHFTSHFQ